MELLVLILNLVTLLGLGVLLGALLTYYHFVPETKAPPQHETTGDTDARP